jgi:hypothetical protein
MKIHKLNKFKICNPGPRDFANIPFKNALLEINNILFATDYTKIDLTEEEKQPFKKLFTKEELNINCFIYIRPISIKIRKNDNYTEITQFSLEKLKSLLWKHRSEQPYLNTFIVEESENDIIYIEKKLTTVCCLPLNSNILRLGLNYAYNIIQSISANQLLDFSLNFLDVNYKEKKGKDYLLLKYL